MTRDFVPISHTFPAAKPLMEDNGRRKALRGPGAAADDLRVQTLKSRQQQLQQQQQDQQHQNLIEQDQEHEQHPPAKRQCSGSGGGSGSGAAAAAATGMAAAAAAAQSGDSQLGGVVHQRSMDGVAE